jgi:hypothetical protein
VTVWVSVCPEELPMPGDSENEAKVVKVVKVSIRGKKYVEFIGHAFKRIGTRGMTEEEVIKTLGDPDEIKDTVDGSGRKAAFRNFDAANQAKVVFEEMEDRLRVITAMWRKRRLSGR